MKRPKAHILEEESRRSLRNSLPSEWEIIDLIPDYGLDIEITLTENEEVTNNVIKVQIKATENTVNSRKRLSFRIETKYLKYYESYPLPVFIFFYYKSVDSFYYIFAQDYINKQLSSMHPNWRKQKTTSILLSPNLKLDNNVDTLKSRFIESCFYVKQHLINNAPNGAYYWLDGIPKSDDISLRKRTLKALTYIQEYKFKLAIDEFNNILKLCTMSPTEKIAILNNIGRAQLSLCQMDSALDNYKAIIHLTKNVDKEMAQEGLSVAYGNMALIYETRGNYFFALKYSRLSLNIERKLGNREGEAAILDNMATIYRTKGQLEKAMEYLQISLKIDREIQNREGEANVLGNIGNVHQVNSALDLAMNCYEMALGIHRELGNRYGEANNLGSLGVVYIKIGELDDAKKYLKSSLNIFKEIGFREGAASCLCNLGNMWDREKKWDKALDYYRMALKVEREIGHREGEAIALGNMGNIFGKKGQFSKSIKYYHLALNIFEEVGAQEGIKQTKQILHDNEQWFHIKGDLLQ